MVVRAWQWGPCGMIPTLVWGCRGLTEAPLLCTPCTCQPCPELSGGKGAWLSAACLTVAPWTVMVPGLPCSLQRAGPILGTPAPCRFPMHPLLGVLPFAGSLDRMRSWPLTSLVLGLLCPDDRVQSRPTGAAEHLCKVGGEWQLQGRRWVVLGWHLPRESLDAFLHTQELPLGSRELR